MHTRIFTKPHGLLKDEVIKDTFQCIHNWRLGDIFLHLDVCTRSRLQRVNSRWRTVQRSLPPQTVVLVDYREFIIQMFSWNQQDRTPRSLVREIRESCKDCKVDEAPTIIWKYDTIIDLEDRNKVPLGCSPGYLVKDVAIHWTAVKHLVFDDWETAKHCMSLCRFSKLEEFSLLDQRHRYRLYGN